MAVVVADTDVLIDYLHGKDPAAGRVELELKSGLLGTTAITVFELLAGAKTSRQEAAIRSLLKAMHRLPVTTDDASRAAAIFRTLKSRGESIPMADCLIAGICVQQRHMLLTRNRKHFERVEGLSLGTLG